MAGEAHNGHEFTHGFTEVKKKALKSPGWHLHYEYTNNDKLYHHFINNTFFYILKKHVRICKTIYCSTF